MPAADGDATRALLIRTALGLMAEHGIEGVELRRIQLDAGQRNRSAIAYHFGDRRGLERAIGETYRAPINAARNLVLDRLEQHGNLTVDTLVDAIVGPLAASLATRDGRNYLILLAEAASRVGTDALYRAERAHTESMIRLEQHLSPLLGGSRQQRRRAIGRAILITPVLLADVA